jgi:hypothetical protein
MIAHDGALRARLEPFAMTSTQLADVFDRPMREPIPDRLLAVITSKGRPAARTRGRDTQGGILDAIAEALFPRGLQLAGAFSLAALFAAGGVAGYVVSQQAGVTTTGGDLVATSDGNLVATGELKVALETKPGLDDETASRSGVALWPAQSFMGKGQRFCREYRIAGDGDSGSAGIACRGADAEWHVAVHAGLKTGGSGEFKLLESPTSAAIESAYEHLKQEGTITFTDKEEAAALASGWRIKAN